MICGAAMICGGIVASMISLRQQRQDAEDQADRLFWQLSGSDGSAALAELSRASFEVRRGVLERTLNDDSSAATLLRHSFGLSVALSRVDFADASRLYREVIRQRLLDAASPDVIEACMILLTNWDLIPTISSSDANAMAAHIARQIEADAQRAGPSAYSPVIDALAPRLPAESADALAARLFSLAVSVDPSNAYDAVHAVEALAPRASSARRRELAAKLVERVGQDTHGRSTIVLAPMLAPLSSDADEHEADAIVRKITPRLLNEWDPKVVGAMLPAMRAAAARATPDEAERSARLILSHIEFELQPAVLVSLTEALNSFGARIPITIYRQAADALLKRIRAEQNEGALSALTSSLGVMNHKATQEQFTEAATAIVSRFASARDMIADAALAAAIDAVADTLAPPDAERLSGMLVRKMLGEQRAGPLLYVAVGLISIADEVQQPGASALARELLPRLRRETNPNELRTLAFTIAAFIHAAGVQDDAAAILAARIAEEDDPDDLRKLASGLYALRGQASAKYFDQAAEAIARDIGTRMRSDEISELSVSLHAMSPKAASGPFDEAAAAIVANVNQIVVLEPALRRLAPKTSHAKAQELSRQLLGDIAGERDPGRLRALGDALADFRTVSGSGVAAKLLLLPDAPCELAPSPATLLNPLCSRPSWIEIATKVLDQKPPAADAMEPDFAQLAEDDDDDAPSGDANPEPVIDFRKLSAALTAQNGRPEIPESRTAPWEAIVLAVCGAAVFAGGLLRREPNA